MKRLLPCILVILVLFFNVLAQNSPLQIEKKPIAYYTEPQCCAQGTVALRIQFLESGKIGNIQTVSGMPCGLTESSIKAGKKIEFKPAMKDGKFVTVSKQVQYSFSLYDDVEEKAEAIIQKAVEKLGGTKYLQVKTIVSVGSYTLFRGGTADLPSSFIDVVSFPAKERTEFKQNGNKTVQTNSGESGWIYDAGTQTLRDQNPAEITNFKQSRRTSLDNILRGAWRNENAKLSYIGKRAATLGKRNDVVKLVYPDGFTVEYEFDGTDGIPMKAVFDGKDENGAAAKEEERYAQFIDVQGVSAPFIVDRYAGNKQISRINYSKIEINKNVPETIFAKPADTKSLKKDLKL